MTHLFRLVLASLVMTAGAVLVPVAAQAQDCHDVPEARGSVLADGNVVSHDRIRERVGKQMIAQTRGHRVRLVAEEGQTEAYLERIVRCQLASGTFFSGPVDLDGLELTVRRSGSYFVVRMMLPSTTRARELGENIATTVRQNESYAARQGDPRG